MKRILIFLILVPALSVVTCVIATGQGATAQISGTVKDQSGAVLPGAEITATQTETGAGRMALSDETGSYVLPNLPVGPYKLEVSLPGFRTFVQSGIVLQVSSSTVVNPVLNVGQVSETVEVQANASLVETRSTGIGQVVETARILELPLIGRQVTDLIAINGAALPVLTTDTTYRGTYPNTTGFSIAGGVIGGNTYTLDGGMHNDVYANYGLPLPFPDALQEFKVETSSLPAQYGFHSGGAVNAVTRSGTNDLHGSLFEFVRNYSLNARNFFAPVRDGLKRNQYGGTIGGAIKQNRLFFFAGYQGTITRQSPQNTFASVPTPDMIAGDFTTFASKTCQRQDMRLRPPYDTNNRLAPSLISAAAVNIAKRLPAAVDQCGRTSYGIPVASDEYFPIGKIDYQISSAHSMFGRYMAASFKQTPPLAISKSVLSSIAPGADDLLQSLTYGDTYLFGPNMINSFRATWNRTANRKVVEPWFGPSDVGMNIYEYVPGITSINVTGGFVTGGLVATPAKFRTTVITLSDDFSVVRSKHQIAFGGSVMGFESNSAGNAFTPGPITITGGSTGLPLADFMAGRILNLQQSAPNKLLVRYRYSGLYAQDSWKLIPNMTLSYGLRWEPYSPQHYGENMMNHFDMDAFLKGIKSNVFVNAPAGLFYPGDALFGPNGNAGMYKQWKHFAPRAGFVWDPSNDGKMVIRAGYGIFYDINTVELNLATGQGPPWGGKVVVNNPSGGLDNPYSDFGGKPFPFVLNKNVPYLPDGVYDTFDPNTRVPYVQQWNLGIQKQIGTNWLVSASYIGNELTHMTGARELDPAIYFPGNPVNGVCTVQGFTLQVASGACSTPANTNLRRLFRLISPVEGSRISIMDTWDDGGTRSYNGMLLSMEKRFSRGYSFSANYTWSHCIGNPANTLLNAGAGGTGLYIAPTRDGDRGDCLRIPGITAVGEDRRHIVNMTGLVNSPKFSNHLLGMFVGNWRLSSIVKLQSGSAFDVYTGIDDMLSGINVTAQRANQISANTYGSKCTSDLIGPNPTCYWVNRNAFAEPAPGTVGNMRPGMLRGPGYFNMDAGLSRTFTFKETKRVELRAEATNVLNHTNFYGPGDAGTTNAQQTAFVTLTGSNFGRIQAARDARILQFALKYLF